MADEDGGAMARDGDAHEIRSMDHEIANQGHRELEESKASSSK